MNNSDAYQCYCEHSSQNIRSLTEDFVGDFGFDTDQFVHFRLKFTNIQKERNSFQKQCGIDTWSSMLFFALPKRSRMHADTPVRNTVEWFRSG